MPRKRKGRGGKSPTKTLGSPAAAGTDPQADSLSETAHNPATERRLRQLLSNITVSSPVSWELAGHRSNPDDPARVLVPAGEEMPLPREIFHDGDGRIEIDGAVYPLRADIAGAFEWVSEGIVEFNVQGCGRLFIGTGNSDEEASRDWADQIHHAFQALFHKQEFELSGHEAAMWAVLRRLIDVDDYKDRLPIVVNETGWIQEMRIGMREVAWWPSEQREAIALDKMPVEFAGYGPKQWFDAVVERDRLSWGLLKARHVQAIDPIPPMSDEDVDAFLAGTKTLADLPEASDDEDEP
jgi:hypothetical protein